MKKRLLKLVAIYMAFVCVLTAVATVLPYEVLHGDSSVVFVVFGSIGLTYFWLQFRPLPKREVPNEKV
jgi:hypothetical protein